MRYEAIRYTDPATGLEVRIEFTRYVDFDAVEWVLHLTNHGSAETPILENIRVADFAWNHAGTAPITLHHAEGSHAIITDFQPKSTPLEIGTPAVFTPFGGRSSDGVLPFFNLAGPEGGLMVAIGWTGQWTASFNRTDAGVQILAGFEQARFKLLPGESVRTPSVLVMPWTGTDGMVGQNKFRRLLLEHIVPQYDGAPIAPLLAASPHAVVPFEGTTEANCVELIRNIAANKLPVDYFWIDAGWFVSPQKNWARGVGNFVPDPERFPNGMKPVADAAHEAERPRFAYMPFSAGPRHCIGETFSIYEMLIHLSKVGRRYRLRLEHDGPVEFDAQVNLRTRHPLQMRLEPR